MAMNIRLSAKQYEDMITRRGTNVLWERAQRCSCWDISSGQPNYHCKACHGYGYIYDAPIEESAILIMSLALNKEFTQLGEYRMGDAIATVPLQKRVEVPGKISYAENPLYWIGEWDQITLLNTEFRSDELLIKDEALYDRDPDTLRNTCVTKIVGVHKADPITGIVTRYTEGVDFVLNGATIEWVQSDNVPLPGEKYSVQYYHRPIYVVYTQLPQHRDQDNQHLPKKVILRYKDVI